MGVIYYRERCTDITVCPWHSGLNDTLVVDPCGWPDLQGTRGQLLCGDGHAFGSAHYCVNQSCAPDLWSGFLSDGLFKPAKCLCGLYLSVCVAFVPLQSPLPDIVVKCGRAFWMCTYSALL